jgi:hypothetical protein
VVSNCKRPDNSAMAGKSGSKAERTARRARVAAAIERGDSPSAIARAEGLSELQARRLVAEVREPRPARELRALPDPEPVRIDPFTEVARAFATQQQVERECRRLAADGRQEAVRLGALKTLATVATARLDMLDRIGALPRGPAWFGEMQLASAWHALTEVAEAAGIDVDELRAVTGARVRERIEHDRRGGMVELAPVEPRLPRRRVQATRGGRRR